MPKASGALAAFACSENDHSITSFMTTNLQLRNDTIVAQAKEHRQTAPSPAAAPIHDYAAKLRHPRVMDGVKHALNGFETTARVISLADALRCHRAYTPAPVSVNLDLTVACNYNCPHCIDGPILNTGKRFDRDSLRRSLVVLRLAGLRSVILIGGGEPTLHPEFPVAVKMIKLLGLQCAIVSNGSRNDRIREIAPMLTRGDWVRLSLDAAKNETFRVMHQPHKKTLTLDDICGGVADIKRANPRISVGFSYIVTWRGASVAGQGIIDNSGELEAAARLAKRSGFDFIAFKPLLDRDELGAEMINIGVRNDTSDDREALRRIRVGIAAARLLEDDRFTVLSSLNLAPLTGGGRLDELRSQPHRCHMRLFRQVLTPLGAFGCPVYRGNDKDRVGGTSAYESVEKFFATRRQTYELVEHFDATVECRNVACLYNSTNWWLQGVRDGVEHASLNAAVNDFFL
jgi:hypothetical protein